MGENWSDIYRDGIRLEKIIKFCGTMIFKKDIDEQLKLSYIDRMIKSIHQKLEIAKIRFDIEGIVKSYKKKDGEIPKPNFDHRVKDFFEN